MCVASFALLKAVKQHLETYHYTTEIECARATNIQYCSVICFLVLKNVASNEIHRRLTAAYDSEVMSVQAVRKWCYQFKNGSTSVFDDERTG